MKNNKELVLTILAVLVLIGSTIGVTYAFFTYSKTGDKNNVLTTGNLDFAYTSTNNGINITNAMPTTVATGQAYNGTNQTFTFTVSGTAPQNTNIPYTIYARAGDTISGKTRLLDSEVGVYLTASGTTSGNHEASLSYTSGTLKTVNELTNAATNGGNLTNTSTRAATSNRKILGTGTLYGKGTASATVTYTLRMWVAHTVTISDEDTTKSYRSTTKESGSSDSRYVYGNMYYSLKVDVEASV